ncbi:hypothetical protein ACFXTO_040617 [Malus domestica]
MKSGKVDSAAKVAPKPAPFAAEIDSPQIQDLKLAISELRFAAYAKNGVDELQRVCVSLLKKNEQLKGENDGLEVLRPSLFLRKTCLLLLLRLPLVK